MLSADALKIRLEQVMDESLAQYPDIKLSDADKVKLLSEWDDEVSKSCASVEEIFDALALDKIIIDRLTLEYEAIRAYYGGHCIHQEEDLLIAMFQKTLELRDVVIGFKAKRDEANRILGELEEAFKFKISHGLHGSSLST
ncbi:unnamed protein product [Fusarium equiseti]|uniref:Uncharacterized protein n=1 Tax=Fusarium equiseti TaxID=61235 RepID=A0A8J2NDL3_FUSEQ|nr:unnamed protein product [Fusarium equiseti]